MQEQNNFVLIMTFQIEVVELLSTYFSYRKGARLVFSYGRKSDFFQIESQSFCICVYFSNLCATTFNIALVKLKKSFIFINFLSCLCMIFGMVSSLILRRLLEVFCVDDTASLLVESRTHRQA